MKNCNLFFFIRFSIVFSIGLLLSTATLAQKNCAKDCSCSISGLVVDASTGDPIPYAAIQVNGSGQGVLTDESGKFLIENLCQVEHDIAISHIGYKSVTHHHDVYHPELVVKMAANNVILESVIVEGHTVTTGMETVSESKLSGKELDRLKSETLGDALAEITGVSTLKTGQNIVKPIIHGLHSNRILIINNGIRHESQSWGQQHAPEIDAAMADNITLVKGSAAVKYGPDAMGGVIIINPPKMELSTGHLHGEAGITAESNGKALNGDLLLQQGYKKFAWIGQVSGLYQGDLATPDYQLTNTGARDLSYMFGSRFHQKNFDVSLYYSHVQQKLGILRGSVVGNLDDLNLALNSPQPFYTQPFSYDLNTPYQEVSHDLLKAKGTYNFSNSQLDFQYGFQINKRKEFDVRKGSNNDIPSINLELMSHSLDMDWIHPETAGWTGKIGAQWLYQDNNNIPGTNTMPFLPNYNNNRLGLYMVESKHVGHIQLEAGFRYDYQTTSIRGRDINKNIYRDDINYHSITGMGGIKINTGAHSTFQTNIGSSWRPPNVAELYSFGKHEYTIEYGLWRSDRNEFGQPVSSDIIFNQATKPVRNETGVKWVGTYNYTGKKLNLELTGYANYLINYIYTKPGGITNTVRGAFPFYIYDQTDALFFGVDGSMVVNHNNRWESRITGSYLRARDVKNNDFFVGIPSNRLGYKLSHQRKMFGFEMDGGIGATYVFKQHLAPRVISTNEIIKAEENGVNLFAQNSAAFDFLPAPEGYLLLNAHVDITIQQLILGLQVKNILNTSYREYTNLLRYFADEPGTNFKLSARYKF